MKKKTQKGWKKSDLDLGDYLGLEPCEIDEELYDEILCGWVAPSFVANTNFGYLGQGGDAVDTIEEDDDGKHFLYSTVNAINDKFFYLGVLPLFKGPEILPSR